MISKEKASITGSSMICALVQLNFEWKQDLSECLMYTLLVCLRVSVFHFIYCSSFLL